MSEEAQPEIRYATTRDRVRIAYSMHGDGPPLVYVRALNSNAEEWWSQVPAGRYLKVLASYFTVVIFDARGNGRSEHSDHIDLDHLVEDVRAVVDDLGVDDVTIYGQGFGSPVAIEYSAREPDLVDRLILYCAYARGSEVVITDQFIATMRTLPSAAVALMAKETYPDSEDLSARDISRRHFTADVGAQYFEFARRVDVEASLGSVKARTLVMQPEWSPVVPERAGKEVAAGILGARFVAIAGGAYNPWAEVSFQPTLRAIGDDVGVELVGPGRSRTVVLLLTDMVGSTAMTQRVGETISRELHDLHDSVVRTAIARHGGTMVQHTGDGIMASFESAADALASAVSIQRDLAERNRDAVEPLDLRTGLAVGRAYEHNEQPFTASAQLVTRVTERAASRQILVSHSVRELVSGTGCEFGPARSVRLKGFPGRERLSELLWT